MLTKEDIPHISQTIKENVIVDETFANAEGKIESLF